MIEAVLIAGVVGLGIGLSVGSLILLGVMYRDYLLEIGVRGLVLLRLFILRAWLFIL